MSQKEIKMGMMQLLNSGIGVPFIILLLLAMVIIPLPAFLLDVFFTFNIAFSLAIILTTIYVARPLEFSVFPTVLLLATLLRLSLNVASTRVVLLQGHEGGASAGQVIEAFGEFVIGGNYAVGIVVFAIIVIINFAVVTKGSGRISEVTARFTLDAMPGKQMAIDADLNAGILSHEEAKMRREDIARESDFYGSMDGASKFVRGDAVAGILILFINIIGGLLIGILQHDLSFAVAMKHYALLTIGDGLVAQIPSLILSTAVAIIVTRMSGTEDMGEQVVTQVFKSPKVLFICGAIIGLIGLIPGMPNIVFILLSAMFIFSGYWVVKKSKSDVQDNSEEEVISAQPMHLEALTWDDVTQLDTISLEVGYRLIPLVDRLQQGELLKKIRGVRKKLSKELGFLIQTIHIKDNLDLSPQSYRIILKGDSVAEAEVYPDKCLAINPGQIQTELKGIKTKDPAFGMDAIWIELRQKDQAQVMGYSVVDPATVAATHISYILKLYAHELLGYEDVQQLLDILSKTESKLIENLVPTQLSLSALVKILQALLKDSVPIRNIKTILETLANHVALTNNTDELVNVCREVLGRMMIHDIAGRIDELPVITLDPGLEQLLQDGLNNNASSSVEPGLAQRMQYSLLEYTKMQDIAGEPAILLVAANIRRWLSNFLKQSVPTLHVLSYNEVPDNQRIKLVSVVNNQRLENIPS